LKLAADLYGLMESKPETPISITVPASQTEGHGSKQYVVIFHLLPDVESDFLLLSMNFDKFINICRENEDV
jgi:hypothetical protein